MWAAKSPKSRSTSQRLKSMVGLVLCYLQKMESMFGQV